MTTGRIDFAPDYKSEKPQGSDVTTALTGVGATGVAGTLRASRTYDWSLHPDKDDAELRDRHAELETKALAAARAWFRGSISEGGMRLALAELERFEAALGKRG